MIYLISQDWANTSNNHAGIKYLCNELQRRYPEEFVSIVLPDNVGELKTKSRLVKKLIFLRAQYLHRKRVSIIFKELKSKVKDGDKIVLMEYMDLQFKLKQLAKSIRKELTGVNLYAMVHLVPQKLNSLFSSDEDFDDWTSCVDKIITLGSTLTEYFVYRGLSRDKVITTFHYVDEYYYKTCDSNTNSVPTVIAMGNQMRNLNLLKKVVDGNPDTNYIICQGLSDMSKTFAHNKNVRLVPFVPEHELRRLMALADISLNVMEDTIGSNVIVTSLAMGLAMICSDVGSIRDYCDESNTLFCKSVDDFSNAISVYTKNTEMLHEAKKSSARRAKELSISRFRNFLVNL